MLHKLGALPPVRPPVFADLADYATLATPPATIPVPKVTAWGMDGNDQYGNCGMCGSSHLIAAWDAITGSADPIPDEAQTIEQYKAITGCVTAGDANDTGLVLSDVLKLWSNVGLFGDNKIAAYAPVNHKAIVDIHQAIAEYGGCYVGVNLPQSAEDQFNAGMPWTLVGDAPVGGHCVVFIAYDAGSSRGPGWLYAVTWGKVVRVDWTWFAHYATEAWAIVPQEFVESGKGPLLNLAQLQADIATLEPVPVHKPWWEIWD